MRTDGKRLLRNFVIELVVYGGLMVVYFLAALQFLGQPLTQLFHGNLVIYAVVGLALIVAQAVVLEIITSFLIERVGLERLE